MICAGLDMITPVPIERWDNELYYDPDTSAPGKMLLGSMVYAGFHKWRTPIAGWFISLKIPSIVDDLGVPL